jgi:hypothetical protein
VTGAGSPSPGSRGYGSSWWRSSAHQRRPRGGHRLDKRAAEGRVETTLEHGRGSE